MARRKLIEITPRLSEDHFYLSDDDACYFLREYTSGQGYKYGTTNSLISNLKKEMDRKGRPEWKYKARAIRQCASELRDALLGSEWLEEVTLCPLPPSAAKGSPAYDDRLLQILSAIAPEQSLDIRELLLQRESRPAAHADPSNRKTPNEHYENFYVDEDSADPPPTQIGLFDDLIVTGSQFVAAKRRLAERFPGIPILGVFVARRRIVEDDPSELLEPVLE